MTDLMTGAALDASPSVDENAERSDMPRIATASKPPAKNRAAQALGRLGGAAGTKAQNAARKQNAQRAGRPKRVCVVCGEPVVAGHVDRDLDVSCGAHGWRWQKRTDGLMTRGQLLVEIDALERVVLQLRARLKLLPKGAA
jgi:hypothetical protein